MAKITVHKTVSWDDRGRRITGKVAQIMGDHVVVMCGKDKYIVSKSELSVVPTTRLASIGPRFAHQCLSCSFLGQEQEYDLYFCQKLSMVVARFGDGYEDCLMSKVAKDVPELTILAEAKRRATAKKLLEG